MSDKPRISPMRMLRAWLFRERAVRGPGAIELDVVDRQVTREEQAVSAAAGEAASLEKRLQRACARFRAALTDKKTPGVVDADESRGIARELVGAKVDAHHHTERLEALT